MKICSLASGSKGNCLYIESAGTRLLIDAGLSLRETVLRLEGRGVAADSINAVLLTHEHSDHIRSVGSFARKFKVPVIASHLVCNNYEKYFNKADKIEFESGSSFTFRDLLIDPFKITHDACDPVGFLIDSTEGRCASVTDLGIITRLVTEKLRGCLAINLESNHDLDMLMNGPYPWELKQRIKSRHGHLSNEESLSLLHDLAHGELKILLMAHLSEVNNHPDHVIRTTRTFLEEQNVCSPAVVIGEQHKASELFIV